MRILFAADVDPDPNSGAAGTEWQTIQALRQLGHEVDEVWASDLGRNIRHGNLHYLLELPGAYRRVIGERCDRNEFDVIHANQGHCYLAAQAHHAARRRGVFVCRSHGLDDRMAQVLRPWPQRLGLCEQSGAKALVGAGLARLLHRHDRLAYRVCDGIIVSSQSDADYLTATKGVVPERIARIAQAPAATFVETPAPLMDRARLQRILHVGGFAYWKGVHAVAKAANQLFDEGANAEMTWVCRTDEHERVRSLLTEPARDHVQLMAWTSQPELMRIYDRHGIFLYPSLFDGFGKVFLEAMARGLCVVGTRAGGMPDVMEDGKSGFLVGFHEPREIVRRVQMLWTDADLAASMSAAAAATARRYSWQRVAMETAGFYGRLIQMRATSENG